MDHEAGYKHRIIAESVAWQYKMQERPSLFNRLSKKVQAKINSYIPEKVHEGITKAIRQMVKGVLFGARHTTSKPSGLESILQKEALIEERIEFYKKTAAAEGGITGAGGFLLAIAEFPILLGIKMKMLFDIATMYGYSTEDYRERIYLLHIFQLAFSSQERRSDVFLQVKNWNQKAAGMPAELEEFDWRSFQQEYRDYIDLAKLAQLIPVIGAVVGVLVNYRLLKSLGNTAMNAYRMRMIEEGKLS